MSNRYQRQQSVATMGAVSAPILANSHAVIVGLGGLGCPVAQLLAGAGVGRLTLLDPDTVSLSNLHRQTLYTEKDIGKTKASIAQHRLTQYNSEICITAHATALNQKNIHHYINVADIVIDCTDRFLTSYLLSDFCHQHNIALLSASIIGTAGYLGAFCGGKSPSLRALFPAPAMNATNCNNAGVTGPSATIIGGYQAQEALKILLNDTNTLFGKLIHFDLWCYRQNQMRFANAKEPTTFAPIIHINDILHTDCVLDVRSDEEQKNQKNRKATHHVPVKELTQNHHNLPRNTRIVCMCHSGQRALYAAQYLLDQQYFDVSVASV